MIGRRTRDALAAAKKMILLPNLRYETTFGDQGNLAEEEEPGSNLLQLGQFPAGRERTGKILKTSPR